jgi:hypothetical protein
MVTAADPDAARQSIGAGRQSFKQNVNSNVGVTKLMQQCTSMLREKMWNDTHSRPAPPAIRYRESNGAIQPDNALEAMGPVLESVLGNLTQEYERALLQKDSEMKKVQDELTRERNARTALEQQVAIGANQPQIEYQLSEDQRAEVERLKGLELALTQQARALITEQAPVLHCVHIHV